MTSDCIRSTRISCMLELSTPGSRTELARHHRQCDLKSMANPLGWDVSPLVCAFFRPKVIGFFFPFTACRSRLMTTRHPKPYDQPVKELMA